MKRSLHPSSRRVRGGGRGVRVGTAVAACLSLGTAAFVGVGSAGAWAHPLADPTSLETSAPAPSEILNCQAPSTPGRPVSATRRVAQGPAPKSTTVSATGDGADGNLVIDLVKKIGGDAVDFGAAEGFGWLLSLLTGGAGNGSQAKIDQTKQDVEQLQQQVYLMCTSLSEALADLEKQVDLKAYQGMSLTAQQTTNSLNGYLHNYQAIVAHLEGGGVLDGDAYGQITEMRSKLPGIIDAYHGDMMGTLTSDGLIGAYADVLGDQFGYRPAPTQLHPAATRIFPADYVHAAWVQYNSYAIQVAQAVWLYAEVQNLDYTFEGEHYTSKPDESQAVAEDAAAKLDKWGALIWAGRLQAGQRSSWVTSSLGGDVPDGTVADLRSQGRPLLWNVAPVTLEGDPAGTAYCGRPSLYCWSQVYDAGGHPVASTLVASTPGPVNRILERQQPLGSGGWHVPTAQNWQDLLTGASGALDSWASSNRLPHLTVETTMSQANGRFAQVAGLPPMLSDTSANGDGSSFAVLTAPQGSSALTAVPSTPDREVAGLIYLVRDMTTPSLSGSEVGGVSGRQHGQRHGQRHGHRHGQDRGNDGVGAVGDPAAYTSVTSCASGPTYTVPDGVIALQVVAVGGHGGDGRENNSTVVAGGAGGVVTNTVPVRPGQQLRVQVGGAGGTGPSGTGTTGSSGGAGGIGGGGDGGVSRAALAQPLGQSGGGGGFSGLASPDCDTWYVVAGGGGGAGAGVTGLTNTSAHLAGGRGGDGCPLTGGSCTTAADGANAATWAGSGHGGRNAPNAAGGSPGTSGTAGSDPSGMTGGTGGRFPSTNTGVGGGGGGGGGYWAGGGGGSGGTVGGPGGGGAGGTSWSAFAGASYGVATTGQGASVTINPVASPDVVIQSSDNAQVLSIANAATADGTPLLQWPRSGAWNQVWNLVPVGDDYWLRNPRSGKCAAPGGPNVGNNPGVILLECDAGGTFWTVDWQSDGTARIVNAGRELSVAGSATGVPVDVAEPGSDSSHRWMVILTG